MNGQLRNCVDYQVLALGINVSITYDVTDSALLAGFLQCGCAVVHGKDDSKDAQLVQG